MCDDDPSLYKQIQRKTIWYARTDKGGINISYQFSVGSGENYAIVSVEDGDAGLYVCEASNTAGVTDSRNITVDVECKYYMWTQTFHTYKNQHTEVHIQNKRLLWKNGIPSKIVQYMLKDVDFTAVQW